MRVITAAGAFRVAGASTGASTEAGASTGAGASAGAGAGPAAHWIEHLRVADLSVGTYSIPAGGADEQEPHSEDEIYVVTAGRATLESGDDRAEVGAGSVIYVPAGERHRFTGITEDLATIVVFAPAEYSRSGTLPSAAPE